MSLAVEHVLAAPVAPVPPTARPAAPRLRLVAPAPPAPAPPNRSEPTDADLFVGLRTGDGQAEVCRDRLVQRYGPLAVSCARRYSGRGENDEDLRQIAFVGLLEAISRFDVDRGVDFEYFARPTVLGHLRRHFRDGRRWVRVPRRLQELATAAKEARDVLTERQNRIPTLRDLAAHLEVAEAELAEALAAEQFFGPTSLDAVVSPGTVDGACRGDLLGEVDERLDLVVGWTALRPLLHTLPEREREILVAIFWREETQAVVGQRLGISQMQVSRILSRTLRNLRARLEA